MEEFKRKDKILLLIVSFGCLLLLIANPFNADLKELLWDLTLVIIASAVAMWAISETINFMNPNKETKVLVNPALKVKDVVNMSREQLINVAQAMGLSEEIIKKMSDEDLMRFIVSGSSDAISRGVGARAASKAFKLIYFLWISLQIFVIQMIRILKHVKSKKKTKLNIRIFKPYNVLIKERQVILKEFKDDKSEA